MITNAIPAAYHIIIIITPNNTRQLWSDNIVTELLIKKKKKLIKKIWNISTVHTTFSCAEYNNVCNVWIIIILLYSPCSASKLEHIILFCRCCRALEISSSVLQQTLTSMCSRRKFVCVCVCQVKWRYHRFFQCHSNRGFAVVVIKARPLWSTIQ